MDIQILGHGTDLRTRTFTSVRFELLEQIGDLQKVRDEFNILIPFKGAYLTDDAVQELTSDIPTFLNEEYYPEINIDLSNEALTNDELYTVTIVSLRQNFSVPPLYSQSVEVHANVYKNENNISQLITKLEFTINKNYRQTTKGLEWDVLRLASENKFPEIYYGSPPETSYIPDPNGPLLTSRPTEKTYKLQLNYVDEGIDVIARIGEIKNSVYFIEDKLYFNIPKEYKDYSGRDKSIPWNGTLYDQTHNAITWEAKKILNENGYDFITYTPNPPTGFIPDSEINDKLEFVKNLADEFFSGTSIKTKLVIKDNKANFTIENVSGSDSWKITGSDIGTDTLSGFKRLEFSDGTLALDIDAGDTAGQAYRLYQAAFARTPDMPGVSYHMNDMESNGLSVTQIAGNFIASPEFKTQYGENPTEDEYINLLYQNVLGRTPQQFEVDYYKERFEQGTTDWNTTLVFFAESPENIALVGPDIANGIWLPDV